MADRSAQMDAFVAAAGWGKARCAPLADDASFRRYLRLHGDNGTAVLMDAPPPQEDVRPFLDVAGRLAALGYSAPTVMAADADAGFILLEDLGDDTFTRVLADRPDRETALYTLAVDLLIDLHRSAPDIAGLPVYNEVLLQAEADLLIDWYWPEVHGAPASNAVRRAYQAAWRPLFARAAAMPATLVLRDFHVDNLLWLDGRAGVARCGLLDFQDAVAGPSVYDLVSLLEDARRDVPAALADRLKRRYLAAMPALDPDAFEAAYAILGAQRAAKVIGIFTRLWRRDGKPGYRHHIPRVWRWLEGDLKHSALAPVADWVARHFPAEARRVPG
jgi:aminoglycoside/choline kinase family phosphotransferase